MGIVVQKFGGTSVSSAEKREQVVRKIKHAVDEGSRVVVVVSAMGRAGEPYATDTLIGLAREISKQIRPRELDLLMSCGEIISSVIMVQTLRSHGLDAVALTGAQAGIVTDYHFNNAHIKEVHPAKILKLLDEGKIVVVAGFQGATGDGEITTLGRGGSDTTAAALGVALKADVVEIYTDVDGVMTADPRMVPQAKPLDTLTYQELCEMAHLGAKVVHPRAVEIAMEGRIPLRIRSTFADGPGTLVADGAPIGSIEIRRDKIVTGLAHLAGMALVTIRSKDDLNENGMVLDVFEIMADSGISVDMIQVAPYQIRFIIDEQRMEQAEQVLSRTGLDVTIEPGFAKVAIVGSGMRGVPGVMAKMVKGLRQAEIAIYHSVDSHTNIACLVKQEAMSKALQALHFQFLN